MLRRVRFALAAFFAQRLKSAEFCVKRYRQPTNIDKGRQTSTKGDKHRQHSIQQSPQARHRTLLASTNVDKARQNRHPSTATLFASFHTSTNGDRHRQERRPKLKLGCAGLETFAYRHDPTNNDKSRQASTKSGSDRAKRAADRSHGAKAHNNFSRGQSGVSAARTYVSGSDRNNGDAEISASPSLLC